jgi:hypothetical protein
MNEKKLSIVILCYNKWNFTKACLEDLSKLPSDHEIIVVDNASIDETQNQLQNSKEIVYHRNQENMGFAAGSNIGYGLSTASNVLFLNNDIRVSSNHSGWTKPIIESCPNGLVGPTMGLLDKDLNFVKEANRGLLGNTYMSGWCLGASKDIWNKLEIPRETKFTTDRVYPQIFSEEYGTAYFEDTDLSFRARKLNIKMQIVNIPVVHFGKQTSKQLNTYALYNHARKIFIKNWS